MRLTTRFYGSSIIKYSIITGFKFLGAITNILFACMLHCEASQYWVRPNTTMDCPVGVTTEQCVTLSDIAANNSKYFTSNTEIHFLAGVHNIASHEDAWIRVTGKLSTHMYNVSLSGVDNKGVFESQVSIINCSSSKFGFAFYLVSNLTLSGLTIIKCGFNATKHMQTFGYVIQEPLALRTSLFLNSIDNLTLRDITITQSTGFGMLVVNPSGTIWIESCIFKDNGNRHCNDGTESHTPGGNVHVEVLTSLTVKNLTISNSIIAHGFMSDSKPLFVWGCHSFTTDCQILSMSAGLDLYLDNGGMQTVLIYNCTFHNNSAPFGANLMLKINSAPTLLGNIIQTDYRVDKCTFHNGKATQIGGGIYIQFTGEHSAVNNDWLLQAPQPVFTISNSTFTKNIAGNFGGAIAVITSLSYSTKLDISLKNNTFVENKATFGAAFYEEIKSVSHNISQTTQIISSVFTLNKASKHGGALLFTHSKKKKLPNTYTIHWKIKGSLFKENTAEMGSTLSVHSIQKTKGNYCMIEVTNCIFTQHSCKDSGSSIGSVINLNNVQNMLLQSTSIRDNMCRGIYAKRSSIEVGGQVYLINNTAKEGAGMYLDCYSWTTSNNTNISCIVFTNTTSMYLMDNHAITYGGAIVARSGCAIPKICFFEVKNTFESSNKIIHMTGNTAGISGSSIFGGNLENCYMVTTNTILSPQTFWSTFNITEKDLRPSVVTSQPYKVCICNEYFSTDHSCLFDHSIQVYPGQTFSVPAVGVGQYNYSSPSVIRATVVNGYNAQLREQQVTQDVKLLCKNLTYSLQTLEKCVTIQLSIETPFSSETTLPELQPATLTVIILDCPLGFELYKDSQKCDCLPHLANRGVTCNILDQTVHRSRTMWIGNFSGGIAVHHNCPFDYCDRNVTDISLDDQEQQCDSNRTGILCGACQNGYSLVLGTSNCTKCSNVYLLLLLPILLCGIGLVVLLLKCNLTVSTGTINGLIFYTNIIQVNNKIFFPPGSISVPGYILSIFIAWMNLDLGIEVCFTDSLDTFARTWLQFLFPIYIWLLVGLLILVCRYSTTVSRLTGSNTVQVLATLFLLSYAKLLRTTLDVFSPITITDSNNTAHLRWLLDGNYGYLHWPHLALFLVGLLTLVVHLIPFTALVLLGPTVQAHTNYRVLGWVTRFKPFLDAYQGPYKTKYRYWTGIMLLVRVFLFAVFAGNALGDPNVNLFTVSLMILVLLIAWVKIGRVYRKSPLNGLELFYLVNLMVTAIATLYLRAINGTNTEQQILSLITVGSALIVFISTLIYHCYSELIKTNSGKKLKRKAQATWSARQHRANSEETIGQDEGENQPQVKVMSPTRTVVCLKELKEPLLDD